MCTSFREYYIPPDEKVNEAAYFAGGHSLRAAIQPLKLLLFS
jgi:hypothetical protein